MYIALADLNMPIFHGVGEAVNAIDRVYRIRRE